MADPSEEAKHIEKLYEYGERLNEAKDKSQVHTLSLLFLGFKSDLFCFQIWLVVLVG